MTRETTASLRDPGLLRADLHVHSYHSGYARHLAFLRTRDCYSAPEAVYRAAKARGMDLVTITDHDSIDGCLEFLNAHPDTPDFFISEEIECHVPESHGRKASADRLKVHVAAYGIDERIHREIQPLRSNLFEAAAFLREQGVFFALNHLFFFFNQQMPLHDYLAAVVPLFPGFEVRNGAMLEEHNVLVEDILRDQPGRAASFVAGSDAHTLGTIGTTYTEAPGRTRDDYLRSLRTGRSRAGGRHGGTLRVAREIYGVVFRYWASLVGLERQDLTWPRRALGLGFSAISLPAEFVPLLVAALQKRAERERIARCRHEWETARSRRGDEAAPLAASRAERA
jgi:predicted metal-dependent phosphoesterase TrpH